MEAAMECEELFEELVEIIKGMAALISEAAGAMSDALEPGDRKVSQRVHELAVILEELKYDLRKLVKELP
jgi:hypothetical protein